jgi:hypothetical protein
MSEKIDEILVEIKEWDNTIEWFEQIIENFAWTGYGKKDPKYETLATIKDFIVCKRNESIKKLNKVIDD